MAFNAVEPIGAIAEARRDSLLWSAALPLLWLSAGCDPIDVTPADLMAMFGYHDVPAPPPELSLEDEREQMERDSRAFAFQLARGS